MPGISRAKFNPPKQFKRKIITITRGSLFSNAFAMWTEQLKVKKKKNTKKSLIIEI